MPKSRHRKHTRRAPSGRRIRRDKSRPVPPGFIRKEELHMRGTAPGYEELLRQLFEKLVPVAARELDLQMDGGEHRDFNAFADAPLDDGCELNVTITAIRLRECVHYSGCDACGYCDDDETNEDEPVRTIFRDQFERVSADMFEELLIKAIAEMARQNLTLDVSDFHIYQSFFLIETGHRIIINIAAQPARPFSNYKINDSQQS
jgi:hypothetical protein